MKKHIKNDPFEYMIMNRDAFLRAIDKKPTLPKAWKSLTETMPEIEDVIRFNTFKVYARILVKFGQVINEKDSGLDKVRQKEVCPDKNSALHSETVPGRFMGWGIQLHRKSYYRLFKKIGGRVKWIYIGKQWNQDAAKEKIKQFDSGK